MDRFFLFRIFDLIKRDLLAWLCPLHCHRHCGVALASNPSWPSFASAFTLPSNASHVRSLIDRSGVFVSSPILEVLAAFGGNGCRFLGCWVALVFPIPQSRSAFQSNPNHLLCVVSVCGLGNLRRTALLLLQKAVVWLKLGEDLSYFCVS